MRVRTLALGGLVGAAVAYLFDPISGRSRRARLRDQVTSEVRSARREAERIQRHLSNVARGTVSELASPGPDDPEPDDATIAQRIHSEVLGAAEVPKDRIALTVVDGIAELRGELDAQPEVDHVVQRVAAVPGVRVVRTLLRVHGSPPPNKEEALRASQRAERRAS